MGIARRERPRRQLATICSLPWKSLKVVTQKSSERRAGLFSNARAQRRTVCCGCHYWISVTIAETRDPVPCAIRNCMDASRETAAEFAACPSISPMLKSRRLRPLGRALAYQG